MRWVNRQGAFALEASELPRPFDPPGARELRTRVPAPAAIAAIEPNNPGSGKLSNRPPRIPAIRLPSAAPMNQIPIICPVSFGGESLVTLERPTGERQSSPSVCRKYVEMSHPRFTGVLSLA